MNKHLFNRKSMLFGIAISVAIALGLGQSLQVFASDGGGISLAPTQAELSAGQQLQVTSIVTDGAGKVVDKPTVTYRVEPTFLGTIDQNGLFTARKMGTGTVFGVSNNHQASVNISVTTPAAPADIELWPVGRELISDEYTISSDEVVLLEVIASDQYGNQWDASKDVVFSSNNPDASFTEATFNPGKLGTYEVRITLGNLVDTNTVTIERGKLYRIGVNVSDKKVSSDDRVSLTATGYDADDHDWDLTEEVTFSTTDPKGMMKGRTYQPGAVGIWEIKASLGTVAGSVEVNVNFGEIATIEILPKDQEVKPKGSISYRVYVLDRDQNFIDVTSKAAYSSESGNFYENRLDLGEQSGTFEVAAEYKDLISATTVNVASTAAKMTITPNEQSLKAALDAFAAVEPKGAKEAVAEESVSTPTLASETANEIEESTEALASGINAPVEAVEEEGEVLGVEDETAEQGSVTSNTNTSLSNTNTTSANTNQSATAATSEKKGSGSATGAWITIGIILALGLIGVGVIGLTRRRV